MQRDWWKQKSTATMRSDGSYLGCSNKTDSTGYYIYRKDGKKDGECWGMDFEQARRDYNESLGSCKSGTKLCKDSLVSSYVCLFHVDDISCFVFLQAPTPFSLRSLPFMRDAVFTLASGLHEILEVEKQVPDKVGGLSKENAAYLHEIIRRNGLKNGITGDITFQDNADRNTSLMDSVVLSFQNGRFVRVGAITPASKKSFKDCGQGNIPGCPHPHPQP